MSQNPIRICVLLVSMKCGVSYVLFLTYFDEPFFAHFGQFSKRLSEITTEIKTNIPKSKLAHW